VEGAESTEFLTDLEQFDKRCYSSVKQNDFQLSLNNRGEREVS